MDVSERKWWTRTPEDGEQGPFGEEEFQDLLRAGKVALHAELKSNQMDDWQPLLDVISSDETFHRRSTPPPIDIPDDK